MLLSGVKKGRRIDIRLPAERMDVPNTKTIVYNLC